MTRAALLTTTALPAPWYGGFDWWHSVSELRSFGMRWSEIHHDAMTRRVTLPPGSAMADYPEG